MKTLSSSPNCLDLANAIYPCMTLDQFYNDTINEQLEIKEDFPFWKSKEG